MSSAHDVGPDQGSRPPHRRGRRLQGLARPQRWRLHATGALCPHAGADLAEGVLHEATVICPWHKAAFDLRSGACLTPPAVDDLPRFPVRVVDGRVRMTLPATAPAAPPPTTDTRCFVPIGAGAAGAATAQTCANPAPAAA
jgi:nitrite reductase/ring-hydroxylating ferredoxin subunit